MNDEMKLKMMEGLLKNAHIGQVNMVVESGATVNYYERSGREEPAVPTDEQVSRAISAINGKDKVLKTQQAFLGICCCLASAHKWPSNKELTARRINQLPDADKWAVACEWESIRKFAGYRFAKTDYAEWDAYKPTESEREIFNKCRDAARAFSSQLQIEMKP